MAIEECKEQIDGVPIDIFEAAQRIIDNLEIVQNAGEFQLYLAARTLLGSRKNFQYFLNQNDIKLG